ncbi:MAG TPA: hypothetical protein VMU17_06460 [Elusimicrobiota bacterium]|nr:hypothetical protein [Elusimicrobiota bacterium]
MGTETITLPSDPNNLNDPGAPLRTFTPFIRVAPGNDQLTTAGGLAGTTVTDAAIGPQTLAPTSELVQDVAAESPDDGPGGFYLLNWIGGEIAKAWGTGIGKAAMIGGSMLILVLALHSLLASGSAKKINLKPATNPVDSAAALADLNRQLHDTSDTLIQAGFDPNLVQSENDKIFFEDGTAIRLHTAEGRRSTDGKTTIFNVSPAGPTHYTTLKTLNKDQYFNSLSDSPSRSDIAEHSAAVHGVTTVVR